MLLVYTHKITPRLTYTFKQLCQTILGVEVKFTSTIEDFIAHSSIKMSYTKQPLSNELFVRSHTLLFENGLTDLEISVQKWGETIGFFSTSDRSDLPFDIFAASFYLISRYEEYLPHVKDDYGRFTSIESLAYKHKFLDQPVVDIWANELKKLINVKFPDFKFPEKKYKTDIVIDVPQAFKYKQLGLLRTFGGTVKDIFKFRFKSIYERYLVLFGFRRDPYDTFNWVIANQKKSSFKYNIFFLIGSYSTYDKNVNTNKKKFVSLIKSMADYSRVGLKVSYFGVSDLSVLKIEKKKIENILNVDLKMSRNSYSKMNLPETYRYLLELEIYHDYTMGYIDQLGFRAGTCTPFKYYDLDFEKATPLTIHPYHCLDYALLKYKSQLDKTQHIEELINRIKDVNGTFTAVFHNYTLSDRNEWKGFRQIFKLILENQNETRS